MSRDRQAPAWPGDCLSLTEARRIALAAQGFDRPRPPRVTAAHVADVIHRLAVLQLDFVNVVCPSHFIVAFSRLGPCPADVFHDAAYRSGEFTEQWAHEASLVPVNTWPMLRYRMETHRSRPWGFDEIMRKHRRYFDTVMSEVAARGPLGASDLPDPTHTKRRMPGTWYGTVPRAVLEACFGRGRLAVTERRANFSRVFDLAERVVPPDAFARRHALEEQQRELLRLSGRAHGVGTAADLADYFRIPVGDARPRLAELVDSGDLSLVQVEGWREPAYLSRDAAAAGPLDARALLSPFDPVVWYRPRTARLFGFDYRFEIFIPEAKRRWGSYVLPFLMGDALVARVDLKSDRQTRELLVPGALLESQADVANVAPALATELKVMATWLGLRRVRVGRRGNLARALSRSLQAR